MIEAKDIVCVDYSDFAIVSDDSVQKIIDHTQNTWQPNRDIQTKIRNLEKSQSGALKNISKKI